jgi:coatomer subunit beta'
VIGYDEGTIMIKIGREEPVASMDSSGKIIWAKHNEIQTVNIKAVGADAEVIFVIHAIFLRMVDFRF